VPRVAGEASHSTPPPRLLGGESRAAPDAAAGVLDQTQLWSGGHQLGEFRRGVVAFGGDRLIGILGFPTGRRSRRKSE
jgi:hypothetical protein